MLAKPWRIKETERKGRETNVLWHFLRKMIILFGYGSDDIKLFYVMQLQRYVKRGILILLNAKHTIKRGWWFKRDTKGAEHRVVLTQIVLDCSSQYP